MQLNFSDGVFNACTAHLPDRLRADPLVAAAWRGLDPANVWDMHCHVFGNGDSGSGLWFNPALERVVPVQGYLQRLFYLNASCANEAPGRVDESVIDRLLNQCEEMPDGFRTLLFAFDWARDAAGRPSPDSRRSMCQTITARSWRTASRNALYGRRRFTPTIRRRSIA